MNRPARHPSKWTYLTVWVTATMFSVLIAYQNLPVVRAAGMPLGFGDLVARELTVWYAWLIVLPILAYATAKFPVSGPDWRRALLAHLAFAPIVALMVVLLMMGARHLLFGESPSGMSIIGGIASTYRRLFGFFLLVYAALTAGLHAWRNLIERREQELARTRLESMLHESKLENLRAQLDPHFLFNALNAISSLVGRDPPRARQTIARLSALLRLSLSQEHAGLIPLSDELEMLAVYLDIQRLRFGDRLRVTLEIDDEVSTALLPRLLLQPIVENAIQHGIERRGQAGEVSVAVRHVPPDRMEIVVEDDGPGFQDGHRERVGLGNARERLALHFGTHASLECANRPDGGARVSVVLPAQPATEASS